jgi:protein phosphatase 2C family protein 2/3
LQDNLHLVLKEKLTDRFDGIKNTKNIANSVRTVFEETCYSIDNSFVQKYQAQAKNCGSTAIMVLILGDRIYCANIGDSRAIISSEGRAIELSWDQNLSREDEKSRIKDNGGLEMGKVHGSLGVTRAFGDSKCKIQNESNCLDYKTMLVTPEIREHFIDPFKDEFIVIASDGLFDELESQSVVEFVRDIYDDTPESICKSLLKYVLDCKEKEDDRTIILVKLQRQLG